MVGVKRRRSSLDEDGHAAVATENVSPALRKQIGIALHASALGGNEIGRKLELKFMINSTMSTKIRLCTVSAEAEIDRMKTMRKRVLKTIDVSLAARKVAVNAVPSDVRLGEDGSYEDCVVCKKGSGKEMGGLICCEVCPNVFHLSCIPNLHSSIESADDLPDEWLCDACVSAVTNAAKLEVKRFRGALDALPAPKKLKVKMMANLGKDMRQCPHCGKVLHQRGLGTHVKACKSSNVTY